MIIDVRGLHHPDHLKEFRRRLEGFCTVREGIDVLMDNNRDDVRKFEMFVRSCRGRYVIHEEGDHLLMKIEESLSFCG